MGYSPNTQIKAADEHLTSAQIKDLRWKTCSLSQQPLSQPIVACRIGLLYNKESIIEYILAKKPLVSMQHTKGLKDFKEVKFKVDNATRRFVCPLTCTEFTGSNRGVLIWKCGCCISEKAFKELMKGYKSQTDAQCPACNTAFTYNPQVFEPQCTTLDPLSHDVVVIVPDTLEENYLRAKLMKRTKTTK
ncbi:replication termination factor 2 [Babesia ovata]|uniref:Replication termination factor 2 n=1 Tax=Babesia ovata TaxID=189622 RepID=A0A2H6KBB6_9APIC|nr:replication termination factor 2 [Babesia ovata]GBE60293.1 replication termination factor 2 [Babesia ovata]